MGMIPILLALCGFVMLWAIVNYNSLNSKKSQIQALTDNKEKIMSQRSESITGLKNLFIQHQIDASAYMEQLAYLPQNRSVSKQAIFEQQGNIHFTTLLQHPDFISLITKLENEDKEVFIFQKKLQQLTSEYNQQVKEMPSHIVAVLFGFKQIPLNGLSV
jgi:LemA protein